MVDLKTEDVPDDPSDPLDDPAPAQKSEDGRRRVHFPHDSGAAASYPADEGESDDGRRSGGVPDMLRRAMVAGLGAVFMTEEGIRALVRDLKLPKEVMGFVVGQAEKSKGELIRVVSEELRRFFDSPALRHEIIKLLSEVTIEVKAEVRLKPEGDKAVVPDVKVGEATVKRRKKA
jgi:hypothetical protein